MSRQILFAGLVAAAASLLPAEAAFADHCRCNGGYSIGGCTSPSAQVYSGATNYSVPAANGYYYQPQQYYVPQYQTQYYYPGSAYYGSYPSYGYSRPGLTIQFGSGIRSGIGYQPYSYGFGQRYGYGFGFGSSFHSHSRHHHHHH